MARAALMSFIFNKEKECIDAIEDIKDYIYNYGSISLATIAEIAKKNGADCQDIRMPLGYEGKIGFDYTILSTLAPSRSQILNGYCWFISYDKHYEKYLN